MSSYRKRQDYVYAKGEHQSNWQKFSTIWGMKIGQWKNKVSSWLDIWIYICTKKIENTENTKKQCISNPDVLYFPSKTHLFIISQHRKIPSNIEKWLKKCGRTNSSCMTRAILFYAVKIIVDNYLVVHRVKALPAKYAGLAKRRFIERLEKNSYTLSYTNYTWIYPMIPCLNWRALKSGMLHDSSSQHRSNKQ